MENKNFKFLFLFFALFLAPFLAARAEVTSTIQLPGGFTGLVVDQVSGLLGNFSPYIILIAGVLLVSVVIEVIIGAIRHRS